MMDARLPEVGIHQQDAAADLRHGDCQMALPSPGPALVTTRTRGRLPFSPENMMEVRTVRKASATMSAELFYSVNVVTKVWGCAASTPHVRGKSAVLKVSNRWIPCATTSAAKRASWARLPAT